MRRPPVVRRSARRAAPGHQGMTKAGNYGEDRCRAVTEVGRGARAEKAPPAGVDDLGNAESCPESLAVAVQRATVDRRRVRRVDGRRARGEQGTGHERPGTGTPSLRMCVHVWSVRPARGGDRPPLARTSALLLPRCLRRPRREECRAVAEPEAHRLVQPDGVGARRCPGKASRRAHGCRGPPAGSGGQCRGTGECGVEGAAACRCAHMCFTARSPSRRSGRDGRRPPASVSRTPRLSSSRGAGALADRPAARDPCATEFPPVAVWAGPSSMRHASRVDHANRRRTRIDLARSGRA